MGEKRKDVNTGKETTQRMKMKFVREPAVQYLIEYELDKIFDQVKEETYESFECTTRQ
jgi:hypothetical protein